MQAPVSSHEELVRRFISNALLVSHHDFPAVNMTFEELAHDIRLRFTDIASQKNTWIPAINKDPELARKYMHLLTTFQNINNQMLRMIFPDVDPDARNRVAKQAATIRALEGTLNIKG